MKTRTFFSLKIVSCILLFVCLLLPDTSQAFFGDTRGISVRIKDNSGKEEKVSLYKGSFALLVGVSRYHAGWPMLESITAEINQVEALLKTRGFKVVKVMDPDSTQLEQGFKKFIDKYGFEKENRLLFFFSGHGHTRKNGRKGYLVPVDAPDPDRDLTGFLQKSLGMNQVLSWAREIEAKHALFLFDSCFSGTVFKQKARVAPPPHITRLTVEPVRQFITAGSAGEAVPANSTFTPVFIDALRYGLADLNKDGYVSATELGLHLRTVVPAHTSQNPQFGTIRDYDLSRGDFIFMTDATVAPSKKTSVLKIKSSPSGASIYIDDKFKGTTPKTLKGVSPGSHTVFVKKSGYNPETRKIEVAAVRNVTLSFPLTREVSDGSLTITTSPGGAKVSFVKKRMNYRHGMRLLSGSYELVVSKKGYVTKSLKVSISAKEDLHLAVTLDKRARVVAAAPQKKPAPVYKPSPKPAPAPKTAPALKPVAPKPSKRKSKKSDLAMVKPLPPPSSSLANDIETYIKNIQSNDSKLKRKTARIIHKKKIKDPALFKAVEDELLKGSTEKLKDRNHVDAMAWLCNVLGQTKDVRYRYTFNKIIKSKTHRKIVKFAKRNLKRLK